MTHTYKVTTIYIKGIANHTRIRMVKDFLMIQDIDIALLQEVMYPQIHTVVNDRGRGTLLYYWKF